MKATVTQFLQQRRFKVISIRRRYVYLFVFVLVQTLAVVSWRVWQPRLSFGNMCEGNDCKGSPVDNSASDNIDNYTEIVSKSHNSKNKMIESMISLMEESSLLIENYWDMSFFVVRELLRYNINGANYLYKDGAKAGLNDSAVKFWKNINNIHLYEWDDPNIDVLLNEMETMPIRKIGRNTKGSKMKFDFYFSPEFVAMAKPMKYPRDKEIDPKAMQGNDLERHNAEIAAFHLDRLLGYCRVPPTTGRRFKITDLQKHIPEELNVTVFKSPGGDTCFYGVCDAYCSSEMAYCGNGDVMEFSLMVYWPSLIANKQVSTEVVNPYAHSFLGKKRIWQEDKKYCSYLRHRKPFDRRNVLLNLIDTHIFDFLTGNRDRHEFSHFLKFGYSIPIWVDNGQGFGTSTVDFHAILTPLRQCCIIKRAVLLKLIKLYKGPDRLSDLLGDSLKSSPLRPVLAPKHLHALDRRVEAILETVARCLVEDKRPIRTVIFDA